MLCHRSSALGVSLAVATLMTFAACSQGSSAPPSSTSSAGGAGGAAGSGGAVQGGTDAGPPQVPSEDFEGVDTTQVPWGMPPTGCKTFDPATGKLSLTLDGTVSRLWVGVVGGDIRVNGVSCVAVDKTKATTTNTLSIQISGTAAAETVFLDLATDPFGAKLLKPGGGIQIDLGDGTDSFIVRGSAGDDNISAGTKSGASVFDLDGDGTFDLDVAGAEALLLSLGPGKDTFQGAGFAGSASLALAVTVFGGAGDDVLQGGDGDDTLHGGEGDDTFVTAAKPDGADTYDGGLGHDTLDYSVRTAALLVDLNNQANDGENGELDNATATLEELIGGADNDVLEGTAGDDSIRGGPGDDVIRGLDGNDTLYGDEGDDVVDGGAGDDTLDGGFGTNTLDAGPGDGDICIGLPTDQIIACELY